MYLGRAIPLIHKCRCSPARVPPVVPVPTGNIPVYRPADTSAWSTSFAQSAASAACLEALPTCKGQSGQLLAPATTAAIIPSWASSSSASSPHGEENIYQRMSSCDGHTFTISGPAAELEPFEECDRVALHDSNLSPMTNLPRVAVIIPTLGRASLQAAVHSVTTQSYENLEIVVSVDGPPGCVDIRNLPSEPSLHLVYGDKQRGPNSARLAGILASHSDYIAFLDDDDRWRSNKLELQMQSALREMSAGANHVVVACRSAIYNEHGDNIGIVPRRLLSPDETVAHYLFCRQTFRPGETGLGSSMLLFDRSLLDVIGLEPTSNLHEDWDLLLRADQLPNTRLVILPDVLLEYVSRPHSLSSQAPWQTSFSWFEERKPLLTRREIWRWPS